MAKKRKKQKTRNTSGLEHHKKVGKTLIPPLMALPQMRFQSWTNERIPELLWACLLRSVLPQSVALAMFREIAAEGFKHKDDDTATKYSALYHSHLRDVPGNMIQKIVSTAKRHPLGYAALRPLLLLETLPHREVWKAELAMEPQEDDWKTLGDAVLKVLDHQ
ncbi:MAG: hypothetical protein Q8J78_16215, partial [Moraxellaceae bacterium]|nr:hypothetical protein [Moraxellaceae bacterium]